MHGHALMPDGRAMSKSRDILIDPHEAIDRHGRDVMRLFLLSNNPRATTCAFVGWYADDGEPPPDAVERLPVPASVHAVGRVRSGADDPRGGRCRSPALRRVGPRPAPVDESRDDRRTRGVPPGPRARGVTRVRRRGRLTILYPGGPRAHVGRRGQRLETGRLRDDLPRSPGVGRLARAIRAVRQRGDLRRPHG